MLPQVVVHPPAEVPVRPRRSNRVRVPAAGDGSLAARMARGLLGLRPPARSRAKRDGKAPARKKRRKKEVLASDNSSAGSSSSSSSSSHSSRSSCSERSSVSELFLEARLEVDAAHVPDAGGDLAVVPPVAHAPGLRPGSSADDAPPAVAAAVAPAAAAAPAGAGLDDAVAAAVVLAAAAAPAGAGLGDVPEPPNFQALREQREIPWGPFKIAPIYSRGIHSGWGASCGMHQNDCDPPNIQCKIHLPFGKKDPLSSDEARWRVKLWCYMGLDIGEASCSARTDHVALKPRTLGLTHTEDQLDAIVSAARA